MLIGFLALSVVACVAVAVAVAQGPVTTLEVETKVIPNKAGTPERPQGVKISVRGRLQTTDGYEKPVVQRIVVLFAKGGLYNGARHAKCSETVLARQGLRGCPPASIMGKGGGSAYADDVITHPKITIVNGGAKRVYFYTVLTNPARVQAPVVGRISKLSGKWSYRLEVDVPRSLQVVAGVPIAARDFHGKAGRGDWLATTFCPKRRRWRYETELSLNDGTRSHHEGTTPCR